MNGKRDPGAHPQWDWDADLEAFAQLMQVSFTLLQPSTDFEGGLRERLLQAAADLSVRPQKAPISRALVVGAAAVLSIVGAAGAGAAWWMWKTRPHHGGLTAFLPARGS